MKEILTGLSPEFTHGGGEYKEYDKIYFFSSEQASHYDNKQYEPLMISGASGE